jgi:hypothetical protein
MSTIPSTDPNWLPPQPRQGMSGKKKLFLGLGIGCGVVLLLCCGGGVALVMVAMRSVHPSDNPKDVVALTKSITDIDIPAELEPAKSVRIEMPGNMIPSWAVYEDKQASATLVVAQSEIFRSQPQANIRQMMEPTFRQQGVALSEHELTNTKIDTRPRTIRGVQATFTIVEGTDTKTKKQRIQVTGVFPGKSASALLLLDADVDKLGKPVVVKMIDSIH